MSGTGSTRTGPGDDAQPALPDHALRHVVSGTIALALVALAAGGICRAGGVDACLPGSPLLQSAAILGSALCVLAFVAAFAKRRGADGRTGFRRHVLLACAGLVPIAAHTTAALDHPPALLLLTLLALGGLGVWARLRGARALAGVFGSRTAGFAGPDAALRAGLESMVARKREVLARLDPQADEAVFALSPASWRAHPLLAWRYQRLVNEEHALLAAARGTPPALSRWRWLHQCLALAFVVGLAVHVLLVTFFAGYVAEGRPIYWWHVTAWNLGF